MSRREEGKTYALLSGLNGSAGLVWAGGRERHGQAGDGGSEEGGEAHGEDLIGVSE